MQCSECNSGEVMSSDKKQCLKCPTYCDKCKEIDGKKTECVTCEEQYTLKDKSCEACGGHCKSCDTTGAGKCDEGKCDDKYVLASDKTCKACPTDCSSCTYDSANSKTVCKDGGCDAGFAITAEKTCEGNHHLEFTVSLLICHYYISGFF
ncbi:hypothetical protein NP493_1386g00032 [Ridgeia piscesae]|uniref:Uncharacterized protein n=1 Tax=Ridgeia piscesae TaxID=27915 RepID=A0AAD9K4X6_RIDPI|nr:hypothetical protein NP493_1386g00032 [Ridgeia piscesae]